MLKVCKTYKNVSMQVKTLTFISQRCPDFRHSSEKTRKMSFDSIDICAEVLKNY